MKKRYWFLLVILLIVGTYMAGPRASFPKVAPETPSVPMDIVDLEPFIQKREAGIDNLKPNNQARIIWADSVRKTEWAVVYLHGFSASPMEGDPTHREFAARYGCNLYVERIAGHGIKSDDAFVDLTPEAMLQSAREALAIGHLIGEKVILMSCSTGGTLSIQLAAESPDLVDALMMYSPNIAIADPSAQLLTMPWGAEIGRAVIGERRTITEIKDKPAGQFTTEVYRLEGLIALQALLDQTMTDENFGQITQPYLIAYYYKNEEEQDPIVSVPAMLDFDAKTSTVKEMTRVVALPDVGNHVMTSSIYSKDLESVAKVSQEFAEAVLGMEKKQ